MAIILFLLSVGGVVIAVGFFQLAESAIHEIEALMCLLGSAVLFAGAAIVDAIGNIKRIADRLQVEAKEKGQSNEKS